MKIHNNVNKDLPCGKEASNSKLIKNKFPNELLLSNGNIYKYEFGDSRQVAKKYYKYIPSAIGGTRDDKNKKTSTPKPTRKANVKSDSSKLTTKEIQAGVK